MNKKITLVLGAAICGIGVWAVSFLAFSTIDKPLLEFSYSSGGDMLGSYSFTSVKSLDKDHAIVITGKKDWHGTDAVSHEYKVPKTVLEGIKDIFNKHKMGNSDKAFKSPFKVLDKGSSSYSFVFENKSVEFDSERLLSSDTRLGIKEILSYIDSECKSGEKLPGLDDPKATDGKVYNLKRPVAGKIAMEVFNYQGKELMVRFSNGLTNPAEINLSYRLFKQGAGKTLVAEKQFGKKLKVFPDGFNEHTYDLPRRLEAGGYVLEIGDLQTSFVLK